MSLDEEFSQAGGATSAPGASPLQRGADAPAGPDGGALRAALEALCAAAAATGMVYEPCHLPSVLSALRTQRGDLCDRVAVLDPASPDGQDFSRIAFAAAVHNGALSAPADPVAGAVNQYLEDFAYGYSVAHRVDKHALIAAIFRKDPAAWRACAGISTAGELAGSVLPVPQFRALVMEVAVERGLASPLPDGAGGGGSAPELDRESELALDERIMAWIKADRPGVATAKAKNFLRKFTGELAAEPCARLVRISHECWEEDAAQRRWAELRGCFGALIDKHLPAPPGGRAATKTRSSTAPKRSQPATSAAAASQRGV
ncbi:MAG: hypothetical protein KGH75_07575 [Rhodospirillales bacterium]|nr:hypothetical protein [Rhodospirillales bacterium]